MSIRNRAKWALFTASVAAVPLFWAAPALAQVEPSVEASEDIIVTARRREESLQDVPVAVSTFSADDLEAIGATDITKLQQTTPNATIQVARGSNSTLIAFIRGVGQQDPLWGFEPGVGLYIDDVYVARPQAAVLDIFDIERIEVLRGPQGTLYGRNTIGGAVKYVTRRMDDEAEANLRGSFGSYGQFDFVAGGSTPVTDSLIVGGAFAAYRRDGFGTNLTTGADHYDKNVNAGRVSLEWTPTDNLFFRLSADAVDDNSNPRHGHREQPFLAGTAVVPGTEVLASKFDTRAGLGDDNNVETRGASLLGEWTVNNVLTFKSVTAVREGETQTLIDFDNTAAPTLDVPAFYEDSQFSQEFQALFATDRVQGVLGVFYMNAVAAGAFDTILGGANLTIATAGKVATTSVAVFGDVSINLTDTLTASVGARWTSDDRTGTVFRANYAGIRSPLLGGTPRAAALVRTNYRNSRTFEEVTPRFSLSWEPTDALTFYGSYGRGFKSGGFDMRGDAIFTPNTVRGYNPEFVDTYEIGAKGTFLDGNLRINAALFQSEYEGQQITRQEPTATGIASFVDNAGSSEITGAELETFARFSNNWSANAAIGWIDAKFNEFRSFSVVSGVAVPIDLSSTAVFQNTPEITAAGSLTFETAVGAEGYLRVVGSASYRADQAQFEFRNPLLDQPAFTLYNLSATYSPRPNLDLSIHGQNLGDEEYRVGGYNFPGALFGNSIIGFYGPPRTVTATINLRF